VDADAVVDAGPVRDASHHASDAAMTTATSSRQTHRRSRRLRRETARSLQADRVAVPELNRNLLLTKL
jgi:hypothetical protein